MFNRDRFLIIIFIFFSFLGQVSGQITVNVTHYSTSDGLSDNRITGILKDKDGFMWFGSWAGINRFDGNTFLTFKSCPGDSSYLSNNRVDDIVEDPQSGYLWLGTNDRQVYCFEKRNQQFIRLADFAKDKGLNDLGSVRILGVNNKVLWLKTERLGFLCIDYTQRNKPVCTFFSSEQKGVQRLPAKKFLLLLPGKLGDAWMLLDKEVLHLKRSNNHSYFAKSLPQLKGIDFNDILVNEDGVLLSAKNGNLISVSSADKVSERKVSSTGINHAFVSRLKKLTYCTTAKGELIACGAEGKQQLLLQVEGALHSIFEEKSGVLWAESELYGLIRFDPSLRSVQTLFPKGNYAPLVRDRRMQVFEDINGVIWSYLNGELRYYDKQKQEMLHFDSALSQHGIAESWKLYRLFYDPMGILWFTSGQDGIEKVVLQKPYFKMLIPKPGKSLRTANEARGLLADRKNRLWLATKAGEIYVYQNGKKLDNLLDGAIVNEAGVYTMLEDKMGNVWMGTKSNGLVLAKPDGKGKYSTKQFLAGEIAGLLKSNSIYSLFEDSKGRLWAGSFGEGLIQIEEAGGKVSFKYFKNYPQDQFKRIRHIAEDARGRIWIGTTEGLLIFNPDANHGRGSAFFSYKK